MIVKRYSKTHNSEVYSVHTENKDNVEFPLDRSIKIEYPFRYDIRFYYRVVGSCNGLLCLLDDQFGQADSIQLWNPVIKRKLKLPMSQASFEDLGACMVVLGFGFDDLNNDYKVVRICYAQGDCEYVLPPVVEVYSLCRGNWHTVEGGISRNCVVEYFWSQVFLNGNVHWAAYKNMGKNNKLENMIVLFNVSIEAFEEMPLPEALENELSVNLCALDVGGSLAVVRYDNERVWSKSCSIWVMKKYGDVGSWSRDYNVVFEGGLGTILGVRGNGDVLMTSRNGWLISYNHVTEKYVDLALFGTKHSFYVGPYFESLVLLPQGNEARQRVPSDSDSDGAEECESSIEDDEDRFGDVEKSEFWMQASMSQYLTALLRSPYL